MFSKLEFFIALRYLKSKNKEKFISITAIFSFVGIALGVGALIVVMSVMNGFREDFTERILGINSHISIYPVERELQNYKEAIRIIEENDVVDYANPIIENQVMIMTDNNTSGVVIKGIQKEDLVKKTKIYDKISATDFDSYFKDNGILMGQSLADKLGIVEGDEVKIISPETNSTILGTLPRIKTYKLVGTFSSGMYEYDIGVVFIPLKMAQKHFKYNNSVSGIEVYLKDISKLDENYFKIGQALSKNNFSIKMIDWKNSNSAFIGALNVERNVMFIILTLIILVATFNIISSLTMLVNDKNKQIALLRTIGFSKGGIMRIFFLCGSMIGIIGTFLGATLGILFAKNIQNIKNLIERIFDVDLFSPAVYFLMELPSKIIISDVIFIIVLSLVLSFLSTIYPAYKASKTNPAEILRYE